MMRSLFYAFRLIDMTLQLFHSECRCEDLCMRGAMFVLPLIFPFYSHFRSQKRSHLFLLIFPSFPSNFSLHPRILTRDKRLFFLLIRTVHYMGHSTFISKDRKINDFPFSLSSSLNSYS